MKEVKVKDKSENRITILEFFMNLGSLVIPDEKEVENIEEISEIGNSKEIKVCYNNIKALEEKYGIEPKKLKERKKSQSKIKSATVSKLEKNKEVKIDKSKDDNEKIQEI